MSEKYTPTCPIALYAHSREDSEVRLETMQPDHRGNWMYPSYRVEMRFGGTSDAMQRALISACSICSNCVPVYEEGRNGEVIISADNDKTPNLAFPKVVE